MTDHATMDYLQVVDLTTFVEITTILVLQSPRGCIQNMNEILHLHICICVFLVGQFCIALLCTHTIRLHTKHKVYQVSKL